MLPNNITPLCRQNRHLPSTGGKSAREFTSFLILAAVQVFFLAAAMAFSTHTGFVVVLLFISTALLPYAYTVIWKKTKHDPPQVINSYFALVVTMFGALAAYFLNIELGLGSVLAAAIVGSVGALALDPMAKDRFHSLAIPLYCGAYVGMSSSVVLGGFLEVVLAGFFTGSLFALAKNVMPGVGGKLGTMSMIGVLCAVAVIFVFGLR